MRHTSHSLVEVFDRQVLLEDDGSATLRDVHECGSSESTTPTQWEVINPMTAKIEASPQDFLLRKLEGCSEFELV